MSQALNLHYLRPWSDVAVLSRANVLHVFPKMLKNQQRFHWHATKWHRQYSSCCYDYSSHLHVLMAVPYKQRGFTLLKLANYVNGTENIYSCSLFFTSPASHASSSPFKCWPLELKQPGKTFSSQHVNFESKGLRMIKDSNTELYWVSEQKRKDSLAARIELSEHQSAATACLHVDINLKESRLRPRYPWEAIR